MIMKSNTYREKVHTLQTHCHEKRSLFTLRKLVNDGWPYEKKDCPHEVSSYWEHKDELVVFDNVLIKGQALVIHKTLRHKYLKLAHTPHMAAADSCKRVYVLATNDS